MSKYTSFPAEVFVILLALAAIFGYAFAHPTVIYWVNFAAPPTVIPVCPSPPAGSVVVVKVGCR